MNQEQSLINEESKQKKISLFYLTEDYKPEEILFREKQIEEVNSIFAISNHDLYENYGEDEKCLLLQGFSGTGKTSVVSHVLKHHKGKYFFGSGAHNPTAFLLLKSLFDITASTMGGGIDKAIEKLKEKKKALVIDEVNKLKNTTEIMIFFDMLNTIYRKVKCKMVLVTNKKGFLEFIPDDGKLTFHPERIDFTIYSNQEIYEIIKHRTDLIKKEFSEFSVEDSDLARVSLFVSGNFDSSIRSALTLTRKCILHDDFSEEFLKNTSDKLILEERMEELRMLTKYQRDFLEAIYNLSTQHDVGVKYPDLHSVKFSDLIKLTSYSPGRVSQLLKYFEEYHGIIESIKSREKAGRTRIIKFVSEKEYNIVENILLGKL